MENIKTRYASGLYYSTAERKQDGVTFCSYAATESESVKIIKAMLNNCPLKSSFESLHDYVSREDYKRAVLTSRDAPNVTHI